MVAFGYNSDGYYLIWVFFFFLLLGVGSIIIIGVFVCETLGLC